MVVEALRKSQKIYVFIINQFIRIKAFYSSSSSIQQHLFFFSMAISYVPLCMHGFLDVLGLLELLIILMILHHSLQNDKLVPAQLAMMLQYYFPLKYRSVSLGIRH